MNKIANFIYEQVANQILSPQKAKILLDELDALDKNNNVLRNNQPIAIIGVACQLPMAKNKNEYWNNLLHKKNCIGSFPENRKIFTDAFLQSIDPSITSIKYKSQGYLENIDLFDGPFFNISPRKCKSMDPEQRLFLSTSYLALEDAGYGGDALKGSKTGVFVGYLASGSFLYREFAKGKYPKDPIGHLKSIIPAQLSYFLDLNGPAITIDTACSSSLVATHLAIQSLHTGECDQALVGSVGLDYLPTLSQLGFLETKDDCLKTLDKKANGTIWGEGVISILIKPLDTAIKDNDYIYAILRASAINNDGHSNGITAPNAKAQENAISSTFHKSGINPDSISYVEMHGSGTALGDPIEYQALTNYFAKFTTSYNKIGIGSCKSSIGHTGANAGLASILKIMFSFQNKKLPPTNHFFEPNALINFENSPFFVCDKTTELQTTKSEQSYFCSLSSFGLSGTNMHLIIESNNNITQTQHFSHFNLFLLSAKSTKSLSLLIKNWIEFTNQLSEPINWYDLCATITFGRGHYQHRIAIIFRDKEDLIKKLVKLCYLDNFVNTKEAFYQNTKKITSNLQQDEHLLQKKDLSNLTKENLEKIAQIYVSNCNFDFKLMFPKPFQKIPLPTYQYDNQSYWL